MANLLYFLPNTSAVPSLGDLAHKYKIAHAFTNLQITRCGVRGGPGDQQGLLLSRSSDKVKYSDKEQRWQRVPHSEAWVGCWVDDQPTPSVLQREPCWPGHLVRLGDGREWMVPVARGYSEVDGELRYTNNLPRRKTLDEKGQWKFADVREEYAHLWEIGERFWNLYAAAVDKLEGDSAAFDYASLHDDAAMVLATNYRVMAAECAVLGLFDTDGQQSILEALVDLPTLDAWIKKKQSEQDGLSSGDGPLA